MDEEQLISQCLNGERERDCEYCPAHADQNGSCCFGFRHEFGDPDCNACELEKDCIPLTHGTTERDARPSSPRMIYPGRYASNSSSVRRVRVGTPKKKGLPILGQMGPQQGESLLVQQPVQPQPIELDPNDGLFKRFLKVGAWGAGEGFFEMALNFFRKRRPE